MRSFRCFQAVIRRAFLLLGIVSGLLVADATAQNVRLRLMASNLTSGTQQSYDPGEGMRILDGLNPDIVMMQEFNIGNNTSQAVRAFVDATFGTSFSFYREAGAQIPNGIISRYPIITSGEWDDPEVSNRDFAFAQIDVPGTRDLWAVSVHLLTSSAGVRDDEATELVRLIKARVPPTALLVIGGDFNSGSRTEALFSTLSEVVVTSGPYPVDKNGNSNTNAGRNDPYDGVYVDADLSALKTSTIIGSNTFANGLVADTRVYPNINDISPARTGDSGVNGMQHMGVVRDFLLPVPVPEPIAGFMLMSGCAVFLLRRRRLGECRKSQGREGAPRVPTLGPGGECGHPRCGCPTGGAALPPGGLAGAPSGTSSWN